MLDEGAYRDARGEATRCDCPFEKAILSACCSCSLARKHHIAEREAVSCDAVPAHETCRTLHDLLREKALFVLKPHPLQQALPHAKEMKIQCGGLLGLLRVTARLEQEATMVQDVHKTVLLAIERFGTLQELPYSDIIQSIAAFESRRRPH